MSDIVEKARSARKNLAEALSLLQAPEAEGLIDSVAEPVARAMGALHHLENSAGAGVTAKAPVARDAVREALAILQSSPESATADRVMEIIAGSLGLLHGLAQLSEPAAAVSPSAVSPSKGPEKHAFLDKTQLSSEPAPNALAKTAPLAETSPMSAAPKAAVRSGGLDMTIPTPAQAPQFQASGPLASTKASAQHQGEDPRPRDSASRDSASRDEAPRHDSKHAPMPAGMDSSYAAAEANLGAHSPTNFYKGLSGNDVVDDGGLFVSTYEIPALGSKLRLTVNMPGGYDFQALVVVKWTRESGAGDAPPGFGCSFTSVSPEARQLIYRYVRNREPLFHDDF